VQERVERFAAFYELLPEASRDAELREHLMTYYQSWYDWAGEVLAPVCVGAGAAAPAGAAHAARAPAGTDDGTPDTTAESVGQFASVLLDGIFMQMVVSAPGFDLEAALVHARRTLAHLLRPEAGAAAGVTG